MEKLYKIETYLPKEALDSVRSALYKLGLGKIGNYDLCMSWYEVSSSWRAALGAKPYLGAVGEIEFAPEYKLEFRCQEEDLSKAVQAIKTNHPYEEVCINIIPIILLD